MSDNLSPREQPDRWDEQARALWMAFQATFCARFNEEPCRQCLPKIAQLAAALREAESEGRRTLAAPARATNDLSGLLKRLDDAADAADEGAWRRRSASCRADATTRLMTPTAAASYATSWPPTNAQMPSVMSARRSTPINWPRSSG